MAQIEQPKNKNQNPNTADLGDRKWIMTIRYTFKMKSVKDYMWKFGSYVVSGWEIVLGIPRLGPRLHARPKGLA